MTLRIPPQLVVGLLFLLASWSGAFGIAFAIVEWRDDETPDATQSQPSPTLRVDPPECQAAIALFESIDGVLARASNPTENLRKEWGRAAANMNIHCYAPTATPPSN